MTRTVLVLLFALAGFPLGALAQGADSSLDPTQLAGRNLFTQHCVVCHVKTLMTAVRTYGPPLSKESSAGRKT